LGFTFRLQAEKYGKGHLDESLSNKILPPFGVKMESGRPHDGNKQTTPLEAASVTLGPILTRYGFMAKRSSVRNFPPL